jgi:hypothetical protein
MTEKNSRSKRKINYDKNYLLIMKIFVAFIIMMHTSCVTLRFDTGDPDDRNKVILYDVDFWVKFTINNPPTAREYRNIEIRRDNTRIDWGRYELPK